MPRLIFRPSFERGYARYTKRDPIRRDCVDRTLTRLEHHPHDPRLKTHPLKGGKAGQFSCSCGYDCRITFIFETLPGTDSEAIALLDVGTHDEVY